MSNNQYTLKTITSFILSEQCDFRSNQSPIHIDARQTDGNRSPNEPIQATLDTSPGGRAVGRLLEISQLHQGDNLNVLARSMARFLILNGGAYEVKIDGNPLRERFLNKELPFLVLNRKVTEINGIKREELAALYEKDLSANKDYALPAILNSLQQRRIVEKVENAQQHQQPDAVAFLTSKVESLVGERLNDLNQRVKIAEGDLNKAVLSSNALSAERETLGWRKYLPQVRFRLLTARWAIRSELRTTREALNSLIQEQRSEERSLQSGKFARQIETALVKAGVNVERSFGPAPKIAINKMIEKEIIGQKLGIERIQAKPTEGVRPKTRMNF